MQFYATHMFIATKLNLTREFAIPAYIIYEPTHVFISQFTF